MRRSTRVLASVTLGASFVACGGLVVAEPYGIEQIGTEAPQPQAEPDAMVLEASSSSDASVPRRWRAVGSRIPIVGEPGLAIDSTGAPFVAIPSADGNGTPIVTHWTGTVWSVRESAGIPGQVTCFTSGIQAGPAGSMYVSGSISPDAVAIAPFVRRRKVNADGTGTWETLGAIDDLSGSCPSLAIDPSSGTAYVVPADPGDDGDAHVAMPARKWDGTTWTSLGADPAPGNRLFLDPSGAPIVVRSTGPLQFQRWDGSSWSALGPALAPAQATPTQVAIDRQGRPAVLALTPSGASFGARVYLWEGAATWTSSSPFSAPTAGFVFSGQYAFALDAAGQPVVAAVGRGGPVGDAEPDDETPRVLVERWDGMAWSALGDAIRVGRPDLEHITSIALAIDQGDRPFVALLVEQLFTQDGAGIDVMEYR